MTLVEIILSVVLGIAGGIVSGFIVSVEFKKRVSQEEWEKELHNEKQNRFSYYKLLKFEIAILRDRIEKDKEADPENILRVLANEPRTPSFDNEKIKEDTHKFLENREVLNDIYLYFYKSTFDRIDLIQFESKLLQAMLNTLEIRKK